MKSIVLFVAIAVGIAVSISLGIHNENAHEQTQGANGEALAR